MSARPASDPSHQSGQEASRRQGLRQCGTATMAERSRDQGRCSQQVQPKAALQLRPDSLQTAAPHRECLLSPQGLPPHRYTLRQAGEKLPRLEMPCRRYRMVDVMSLGPNDSTCRNWRRGWKPTWRRSTKASPASWSSQPLLPASRLANRVVAVQRASSPSKPHPAIVPYSDIELPTSTGRSPVAVVVAIGALLVDQPRLSR